jgi:hypothetical protein
MLLEFPLCGNLSFLLPNLKKNNAEYIAECFSSQRLSAIAECFLVKDSPLNPSIICTTLLRVGQQVELTGSVMSLRRKALWVQHFMASVPTKVKLTGSIMSLQRKPLSLQHFIASVPTKVELTGSVMSLRRKPLLVQHFIASVPTKVQLTRSVMSLRRKPLSVQHFIASVPTKGDPFYRKQSNNSCTTS